MQEIYKDIPGFDGLYLISNLGNVKSLPKKGSGGHNGKILHPSVNSSGYSHLYLCKDGGRRLYSIHRLVVTTFTPNIENKEQVNHINGIKTDNRLENLEWCTRGENEKHKYKLGYKGPQHWLGKKSIEHTRSVAVGQYDIEGILIETWDCITDIYRDLGYNRGNISSVCKGKRKIANGFIWKYL